MPYLFVAALLSGVAGLAYQIAWTRRFASVTSATVDAQAIVLAVFMAGLGVGSWLARRRASQADRPLLSYAYIEWGAASLAILSVFVIDESDHMRKLFVALGLSSRAALTAQLLALSCYLLLPTTLLGATIPFLIEAMERRARGSSLEKKALAVGWIYATNTLGAVVGCLLAGFVTIEALGLSRTLQIGAALACIAGALTALLAWGPAETRTSTDEPELETGHAGRVLFIVAALAGFVGLAGEVLWTRLVSLMVLNTVYAFTQVLAAVLLGVVTGGLLSIWIGRRRPSHCRRWAGLGLIASGVWTSIIPTVLSYVMRDPHTESWLANGASLPGALLLAVLIVPPAAGTAMALPLLAIAFRSRTGAQSFGALYAANTLGSVLGSLVAGFVLIEWLGTGYAIALISLLSVGIALLLLAKEEDRKKHLIYAGLSAGMVLMLTASTPIPEALYSARVPSGTKVLEAREGVHSNVMVTQDDHGIRRIWINSAWVAGTGGAHKALGHLPALFLDQPKQALGIALGTGQTFATVMQHGFEHLDCVEIDEGVIALSRKWFGEAAHGLLDRKDVTVHHDDGRAFLRSTDERYSLIVLEPLQAWSVGTSNLYSKEFYEEAQRRLEPGGIVAQWIPFYGQSVRMTQSMVRTGLEVFPRASLWLDQHDGILLLHDGDLSVSTVDLETRLSSRGVGPILAESQLGSLADIHALFVADQEGLGRWSEGAPILTDDRPFLEFEAARLVGATAFVEILRSLLPFETSPSGYVRDADFVDQSEAIRGGLIGWSSQEMEDLDGLIPLEQALGKAPSSALLKARYTEAVLRLAYRPTTGADLGALYERALRHDPGEGRISVNLAIEYVREDRRAEAIALLEATPRSDPAWPRAGRLLRLLKAE